MPTEEPKPKHMSMFAAKVEAICVVYCMHIASIACNNFLLLVSIVLNTWRKLQGKLVLFNMLFTKQEHTAVGSSKVYYQEKMMWKLYCLL